MRDTFVTMMLAILGIIVIPFFASAAFAQARTPMVPGPTMCTMQYDPVCGAQPVQCVRAPCYPQYKTYGNACMAGAEGATIIHKGECAASETGPVMTPTPTPTPTPKPVPAPYTPPASCKTWFDGCNSCSKMKDGGIICTKKACSIDNTDKGYCTSYEKPKPTTATSTASTTPTHQNIKPIMWWHWFLPWGWFWR